MIQALIQNETTTIAVQVNGKLRDTLIFQLICLKKKLKLALSSEKVQNG